MTFPGSVGDENPAVEGTNGGTSNSELAVREGNGAVRDNAADEELRRGKRFKERVRTDRAAEPVGGPLADPTCIGPPSGGGVPGKGLRKVCLLYTSPSPRD